MKLNKILKYIDNWTDVCIWYADNPSDEFQRWEGCIEDIPEDLKKYQLIKAKNNDESEAIFPIDNGKSRITIVKEQ